jgi:flagellar hook-length control protein FliK
MTDIPQLTTTKTTNSVIRAFDPSTEGQGVDGEGVGFYLLVASQENIADSALPASEEFTPESTTLEIELPLPDSEAGIHETPDPPLDIAFIQESLSIDDAPQLDLEQNPSLVDEPTSLILPIATGKTPTTSIPPEDSRSQGDAEAIHKTKLERENNVATISANGSKATIDATDRSPRNAQFLPSIKATDTAIAKSSQGHVFESPKLRQTVQDAATKTKPSGDVNPAGAMKQTPQSKGERSTVPAPKLNTISAATLSPGKTIEPMVNRSATNTPRDIYATAPSTVLTTASASAATNVQTVLAPQKELLKETGLSSLEPTIFVEAKRTQGLTAQPATQMAQNTQSPEARQIANQLAVQFSKQSDGTTVIRLNPEELGQVRMALKNVEGVMTMTILAERPETADAMRRNINELAQEFKSLGYSDLNFAFGGDETPQQNGSSLPEGFDDSDSSSMPPPQDVTKQPDEVVSDRLDLRL